MYMRGVSAIDPTWLPIYCRDQCAFTQPLLEPTPYWNDETGEIMCHVNGTFGKQAWQLPTVAIEHPTNNQKYRYLIRSFGSDPKYDLKTDPIIKYFYFLSNIVCTCFIFQVNG